MSAARDILHYDTLVLGAGTAGLACAAKLHQQHPRYRSDANGLLVLEGRDRIGGRVHAVHVDGCRLDTGANWIHGVGTPDRPNPLMAVLPHKRYRELAGMVAFRPPAAETSRHLAIASDDGGPADGWVRVPEESLRQTASSMGSDGSRVIPAEVAGKMYGGLWGLIGELHEVAASTPAKEAKQTSLLRAIQQTGIIGDILNEIPPKYHEAFQSMPSFIEVMEAGPLVAQSAEHPEGQPGLGLLEFAIDDFDGAQVFLQDGYLAVIEEIAKDLRAAQRIRTGVEVTRIRWDQDPIVVETIENTYSARNVVCTIPLGVLQYTNPPTQTSSPMAKESLFSPSLPKQKLTAIHSLGFGTLDKVFLTYSHAWWEEEPYASQIQAGLVERPLLPPNKPPTSSAPKRSPDSLTLQTHSLPGFQVPPTGAPIPGPRPISCINLHSLTNQPALSFFLSGANATHLEHMSETAAQEFMHTLLQTSLSGASRPATEIPSPTSVHVTRWASDPFSRGSYSHMIAGLSEAEHRAAIAAPLKVSSTDGAAGGPAGSELRFAGEHTSLDHFATVHGALLSGWREAEGILRGLGDGRGM